MMTDVIITSVVDPQANVAEPLSDGAVAEPPSDGALADPPSDGAVADPQSANDSSHAQLPSTKDATPEDATTEGRRARPKPLESRS